MAESDILYGWCLVIKHNEFDCIAFLPQCEVEETCWIERSSSLCSALWVVADARLDPVGHDQRSPDISTE